MITKELVLITSHFPYAPGEEFLADEIKYWAENKNILMNILPLSKSLDVRTIPKNIKVNDVLNGVQIFKWKYALKSFLYPVFYKELLTKVLKNPRLLKYTLSSFIQYLFLKDRLEIYLKEHKNKEIIFYTYWHNEVSYALDTLKNKYKFKYISRIHRIDLYQEARSYGYMPFKREFVNNIDKIYTLTQSAQDYLSKTYGFSSTLMQNSSLGIDEHKIKSKCNDNALYHIASCSYITEVKQLDKLVLSLERLASLQTNTKILWTHIGLGAMEKGLKAYALSILDNIENLSYRFIGALKNEEVFSFYENNKVDVFINVSKSEGVPVSIMEALHCHIPIIAPEVGGINEMVRSEYNGILLSAKADVEEISQALLRISLFKTLEVRENAYSIYKEKYDAKKNYTFFIESVLNEKENINA